MQRGWWIRKAHSIAKIDRYLLELPAEEPGHCETLQQLLCYLCKIDEVGHGRRRVLGNLTTLRA